MEEAVHGISGGLSGLVAISVWYPLDVLRFREQTDLLNTQKVKENISEVIQNLENKKKLSCNENMIESIKIYLSSTLKTFNFAKNIIQAEGFSALYNGIGSAAFGTVASYSLYFYAYKYFKNLFKKLGINNGVLIDSLLTSLLAACTSAICSNPIWVLNSRMSKSSKDTKDKSNWEMIKQMIKEEGIGSFFKGIIPSLFLTANPAIQFMIYEYLRMKHIDSSGKISGFYIIINSIISKYLSTIITYPIIIVKTLFQANQTKTNTEIFEILMKLFKDEGISGYYKGISAKVVQTLINNVILMFSYEKIQFLLKLVLIPIVLRIRKNKKF
jgi:hypothetical protein